MRARGFTLVEVLVALVIVAAGAAAVLSSLNTAAVSTTYLRDKTFAGWIAENRIAELRLQTMPPQNGKAEGELDYAGQRWRWRQEITNVELPGIRRIDVSVRPVTPGAPPATASGTSAADEGWTVTLSGVLARDLAGPGGPIDWDGQPGTGQGGGAQAGGANGSGAAGGSDGGSNDGNGNANGAGNDGSGGSRRADPPAGGGMQGGSP